jgi:hypothetical protein
MKYPSYGILAKLEGAMNRPGSGVFCPFCTFFIPLPDADTALDWKYIFSIFLVSCCAKEKIMITRTNNITTRFFSDKIDLRIK